MITKPTSDTYCYVGRNLAFLFYDDMDSTRNAVFDVWTLDLSGTEQGAGGVGGLAWVKYNDTLYIPHYDANGNIMGYYDGTTKLPVASYVDDAFGRTITQSGPMATFFRHRFSTKYYDEETGLYYYGYRFYSPEMGRWLNRDPEEERGGFNLFSYCMNNAINSVDLLGLHIPPIMYLYAPGIAHQHDYVFNRPSEIQHFWFCPEPHDEEIWFETHYKGWITESAKLFAKEITQGITCNKNVFDGPSTRQGVYPSDDIKYACCTRRTRGGNEEKYGDKKQNDHWADKVLGCFAIDYITPVYISYHCEHGKKYYSWKTIMYVEDHLGLDVGDLFDDTKSWLYRVFPSRTVKRAQWILQGSGKCNANGEAIPTEEPKLTDPNRREFVF